MKTCRHLLLVLVLGVASLLRAFDLQQFMHETQRLEQGPGGVTLIWWIPPAYWEQSLKNAPNLNAKQVAEVVAALEPYLMFAVVKMEMGALGTLKTKPRDQLLDALDIKFEGRTIDLAQDHELSQEVKNLTTLLKPLMAGMLGQLGQGLEFVIFPNVRAGKKVVDPRGKGTLEAKLFEASFRWRLPLGVLLPPRVDAKSGEVFPGNYNFNPFTGERLISRAESSPGK